MSQRAALVTGGSRGIGAAIALRLAADGYDVAISYASNEKAAAAVVSQIEAKGRKAVAIKANGGTAEGNIAVVAKAVETFGRLDALVCNAGIYPYGPIDQMSVEQIDKVLNLNVRAVMVETMEAVKHMGQGGRLIYIGSAFGARAPFPGISLYAATKAALEGFAKGVARDVGPKGITVNVVEPGPIDTDLNPADGEGAALIRSFTATESYGNVADIADFVGFLASPAASYITGASLPVDGGLTA
ncbi:oxidoreductase/short-chain dehydrogenase/reductase SDR [Gluconobacter thailandicus F149-1 = NBRC 100600]|uniref:Oxidoreductase n=1 Tax=Gluconobacter thailandicus NBRC 3257 TaxID=1381097 RepID=A0ABQ0IUR0_GLUTH|nr:SDR family oxidoreductase [Gluconobacter thailandicus]KXV55023.1 oxidoreductase [Gluconobacter thailandicus]GAC86344.1 oxidoreductase [Gluconobacter thailandicus NBRC 3255]GAD25905.1 oxidoreductase [Gluconobacter thailandicus NBRC 3257]GAN94768.1 oxidoreductase/short-chain dehydrogenase/reductase SDR [Gluconobacter thailandicus F149-1 = NBRC 100600]GBR58790.1 oxidoreductase [Gluconobacter thailandicus F149-1 = NBRC 100600]